MKKSRKNIPYLMGLGAVAVGVSSFIGLGIYTFQDMKKPGKLDEDIEDKNLDKSAPQVSIYFTKEEQVTREIKRLQRLRRMMRKTGLSALKVETKKALGPKCGAI